MGTPVAINAIVGSKINVTNNNTASLNIVSMYDNSFTEGDLNPNDVDGHAIITTLDKVTSITFTYSNGPDDEGQSDDHAIRINGFEFCPTPQEICDNGIDDDGDLAIDEDDPDCYSCTGGLLTNPDFQSDLSGWTDWGFTTITQEGNGNKYASITGGAGGFGQDEAAVEGEEVTLTFQAKKINTAQASVGFAIYDASWTKITSDQAVTITSDNFQKYTITYTLPANTAWIQPFGWNNDGVGELHVDGFCLTKSTPPSSNCNILSNPEFDNGLNNWVLENNSTASSTISLENTVELSVAIS
jgi:hypothetical protein